MNVEIITIGDEILIGQIVDTNSAWMATELNQQGFSVKQITSVHDDAGHITAALDEALARAEVVLITGGLGPTADDITKPTLCRYFNTRLVHSAEVESHLHQLYAHRPEVLNRLTETQALVPEACTIIPNDVGSAPIMWFERGEQVVVSMPGVPYEMKHAMSHYITDRLKAHFRTPHICHRTTIVYGIPESELALRIADWEASLPAHIHLAYLPTAGLVKLRLSGTHEDPALLSRQMDELVARLDQLLGQDIVCHDDLPFEVVLGSLLRQQHATISTAESCTGGTIASLLTRHSGSSDFFKGGIVSYSNEVKHDALGVSQDDLMQHGAVSQPVVEAMARGALSRLHTDYSIATSGIAGPTGGTEAKPVGTVWVAVASKSKVVSHCFRFGTLREQNILRATQAALVMAIRLVRGQL